MSEEKHIVESLVEANDLLQGELSRLRDQNKILRKVHSALRRANDSLRRQVELARQNDELFKQYCDGDFDAPSSSPSEGGLPTPRHEVEPLG
jgi:hypothetical protein